MYNDAHQVGIFSMYDIFVSVCPGASTIYFSCVLKSVASDLLTMHMCSPIT